MDSITLNETNSLWTRVLNEIEIEISDKNLFVNFFKDTYIYSIERENLVISCNSTLAASVLSDKYKDFVNNIVKNISGTNFSVIFAFEGNLRKEKPDTIIKEMTPKFLENCIINPNFTFENFVVGSPNLEAKQASLIVASNPGKFYNPLFIYGASGLGKTHLLNAIGNHIKENMPSSKILYCSSQTFFEEYQNSIKNSQIANEFRDYLKSFDILLIDDIQFFQNKRSTEEFFFNIFESLTLNNKQIVISSDRSPSELKDLDQRLQTRFSSGLQISIQRPTTEMCIDIIHKKIDSLGLPKDSFSDDVIYLVADKFKNSVRELEGAFNRLLFYSNMNHKDVIDMDLAISALQSLINLGNTKSKVSAQKILNIVAAYYNLSVTQITGRIKTAQIVNARHISVYLIRTILDMPLKEIGTIFNRDHSTIMHSVEYVEKMLKNNEQFKTAIDELKKRVNA